MCGDFLRYLSKMPQLRTMHDKPGRVVAQVGQMALEMTIFSKTLSTDSGVINLVLGKIATFIRESVEKM